MKITIITVVLNGEKYIRRAIESVISQDYDDIEYIIVDGESKDKTLQIITEYKKFLSLVISEPDDGLYHALNKAILRSNGELIGILHSDDWLEKNAISAVCKKYLQGNQNSIIYGAVRYWDEYKKFDMVALYSHNKLNKRMISHPGCFVPQSIYSKFGVFDTRYELAADYDFMLRMYCKQVNFVPIEKILSNFSAGGLSTKKSSNLERISIQKKNKLLTKNEYYLKYAYYQLLKFTGYFGG